MIDHSLQMNSDSAGHTYHTVASSLSSTTVGFKGSQESSSMTDPPFPSSTEDVNMETSADKRSGESPDSTLKPEGKSLKTSGVATATVAESNDARACATDAVVPDEGKPQVPTIRWKPKTIPEARKPMWQVHQCMPAWKSMTLIESLQTEHVDLAALAEATGLLFDSSDLLKEAVKCLEEISKDTTKDVSSASGAYAAPPSHSDSKEKKDDG